MENDQDALIDRLQEQSLNDLNLLQSAMSEAALELVKLRVSYFDKLIVLNAGTLALSFSAVFTFVSRTTVDMRNVPIDSLLNAWKLLIFSIIGALISNWLHMNF
jgi:hypothetical protein